VPLLPSQSSGEGGQAPPGAAPPPLPPDTNEARLTFAAAQGGFQLSVLPSQQPMPLRLPTQFGTDLFLLRGFAGTDADAVVASLVCPYVMPPTASGHGGPLPLLQRGSATQTIPVNSIKEVLREATDAGAVLEWVKPRMDPACYDVIYPHRVSSSGHRKSFRAKLIDLLKRTRNDDCHTRVAKHLMEQGGAKIVTHRTGRRGNPARFLVPDVPAAEADPAAADHLAQMMVQACDGNLLSSALMEGIIGVLKTTSPPSGRVIAGEGGTVTVPVAAHLVRLVAIRLGIRSVDREPPITTSEGQMFWEAVTLALRAGDPGSSNTFLDAWEAVTWVKELAHELGTSPQNLQGLVRTPSAE